MDCQLASASAAEQNQSTRRSGRTQQQSSATPLSPPSRNDEASVSTTRGNHGENNNLPPYFSCGNATTNPPSSITAPTSSSSSCEEHLPAIHSNCHRNEVPSPSNLLTKKRPRSPSQEGDDSLLTHLQEPPPYAHNHNHAWQWWHHNQHAQHAPQNTYFGNYHGYPPVMLQQYPNNDSVAVQSASL